MSNLVKDALILAESTFRKYASLHTAKQTEDGDVKASANECLANTMAQALSACSWNNPKLTLPHPYEEVLVKIDGKRNPMWRNNYCLVAYCNEKGEWFEERHPSKDPIVGVIGWKEISY